MGVLKDINDRQLRGVCQVVEHYEGLASSIARLRVNEEEPTLLREKPIVGLAKTSRLTYLLTREKSDRAMLRAETKQKVEETTTHGVLDQTQLYGSVKVNSGRLSLEHTVGTDYEGDAKRLFFYEKVEIEGSKRGDLNAIIYSVPTGPKSFKVDGHEINGKAVVLKINGAGVFPEGIKEGIKYDDKEFEIVLGKNNTSISITYKKPRMAEHYSFNELVPLKRIADLVIDYLNEKEKTDIPHLGIGL